MPTVINTNLASLYAQNNLSNAQNSLAQSVSRLSSGLRINSAKDDAAGLAISQNMQGQINSVNQSRRNLNDATNLLAVSDTALGTIHDMLLRIKQLATQGYDGSMSSAQKTNIVDELSQLNTEINNTSTRTKFNGNSLISASSGVDVTATRRNGITVAGVTISELNVNGAINGTFAATYAGGTDILTLTNGTTVGSVTLTNIAANTSAVINFATLGISFRLTNGTTDTITADTIGAAYVDANAVKVTTTNPSLDFQAGADTQGENLISYNTMNVQTVTTNTGSDAKMTNMGSRITGMVANAAAYTTAQWATAFSNLGSEVDIAINFISDKRSYVGALTNRISYINQNLEAQSTNLQSSRSQIIDTDFAAETARLTKGQIMQQAATAMLAQANQMPNVVLSLLK